VHLALQELKKKYRRKKYIWIARGGHHVNPKTVRGAPQKAGSFRVAAYQPLAMENGSRPREGSVGGHKKK